MPSKKDPPKKTVKTRTLKQALTDIGKMKKGDFGESSRKADADARKIIKDGRKLTLTEQLKELRELVEMYRKNTVTAFRNNGARQEAQDKRLDALESRLPSPAVTAETETWVPKKGDWLAATAQNQCMKEGELIQAIAGGTGIFVEVHPGQGYSYAGHLPWVRKALPSEVSAHLQAQEEAKITELINGDACGPINAEQLRELKNLLGLNGGSIYPEGGPSVVFKHGTVSSGPWSHESDGRFTWLLYPEFLRRARGTAARIERERIEEEKRKPLEFGMNVKTPYGKGLAHNKARIDGDHWWFVYADGETKRFSRKEVTIL
jgi:hypothetical protein